MKVMSIRLPEELYAKLEAQAEAVGVAPAVLARIYLKRSIDKFQDESLKVTELAEVTNEEEYPLWNTSVEGATITFTEKAISVKELEESDE